MMISYISCIRGFMPNMHKILNGIYVLNKYISVTSVVEFCGRESTGASF